MQIPHTDVINVFASLVASLEHLQILKYVTVSGLGLLCYDYLLTLEDEMNFVWPSKWGVPKILYLLNRYMAFWDAILLTYTALIGGNTHFCKTALQVCGYAASYGILIAEIILMMRTWAVWGRARSITIILAILLFSDAIAPAFIDRNFFEGFSEVISNPSPKLKGCLYNLPNRFVFLDFVLVIITETIVLGLLVFKSVKSYRVTEGRHSTMNIIFVDGIIYFIAILCASIANLVAILVSPIEMCIFLIITQRVLHSCCCSRVLLHIRSAYSGSVMEYSIAYPGPGPTNTTIMPRFQGFGDTTMESDDSEELDVPMTNMKGKTPDNGKLPEKNVVEQV